MPNDVELGNGNRDAPSVMLLTGPNMVLFSDTTSNIPIDSFTEGRKIFFDAPSLYGLHYGPAWVLCAR